MHPPKSYRESFQTAERAAEYDYIQYAEGSISDLIWQIEAPTLERIVRGFKRIWGHIDYLDFACGSGRILSLLETHVETATGIDVSQAMLDRARAKVNKARLLCRDLTADDGDLEGRYDLITAFRFFLNAEPTLRREILQQLAHRLKGPESRLVLNIHGNILSYKLILLPYHWLRARFAGRAIGGYLSKRELWNDLAAAGFVVEAVFGMGFIPGKILPLLPFSWALWLERRLIELPLIQKFGVSHILVCRLAGTGLAGSRKHD